MTLINSKNRIVKTFIVRRATEKFFTLQAFNSILQYFFLIGCKVIMWSFHWSVARTLSLEATVLCKCSSEKIINFFSGPKFRFFIPPQHQDGEIIFYAGYGNLLAMKFRMSDI